MRVGRADLSSAVLCSVVDGCGEAIAGDVGGSFAVLSRAKNFVIGKAEVRECECRIGEGGCIISAAFRSVVDSGCGGALGGDMGG